MRLGRTVGGRAVAFAALVACLATAAPAGSHTGALAVSAGTKADPPPLPAQGCPLQLDPAQFADADRLRALNQEMADFGKRPTGSPNHQAYVASLERHLAEITGLSMREIPYEVDSWLARSESMKAAGDPIPLAGPVPYSKSTPKRGASGELVFIPRGTAITADNAAGKIVVRDAATTSVPKAAFAALEWWSYDPDLTLTKSIGENYERDYLAYLERIADLEAAADAGAAGIVLAHSFPREQVRDHYAPYEGIHWRVPAVQVGVDEGTRLKAMAGQQATIKLSARRAPADTKTLVATLPGMSEERLVVQSHTDGMNAVWDNGPPAMIAMAEHMATLPNECRPRTIEFVFTTAHLHQRLMPPEREGGAGQYAKELDKGYDDGTVALVLPLEHLGALEYDAVPRAAGLPGRELKPTGEIEPVSYFVGESPALIGGLAATVIRHDLRGTIALRGADLPGARIPPHLAYGGEGTPYQAHLIPSVALVTGPWTLYNPAFGMEALDMELMRKETLVATDLLYSFASVPREVLGGGYVGYRAARSQICGSALETFAFVQCPAQ